MDIASALQSHPLFETFTAEALSEAVRAGVAVTYQPGDVCLHQGEPGEIFGVLLTGRLEAARIEGPSQREHLGYIQPGECFGEMSLLTGNPTSAEVSAVEKSQAVVFAQEAIGPIIALNREAVQYLTRLITSRLVRPQKEAIPRGRPSARYSLGASSPMRIMSLSCRITDLRYSYFDTTSERPIALGNITGLGSAAASHVYKGPKGERKMQLFSATHEAALEAVLAALTDKDGGVIDSVSELSAIGHRVCHGGTRFNGPAVIDDAVEQEIRRLIRLAPFENEYNLKGIEACRRLAGDVVQVAVFDTSFHLKMPPAAYRYPLFEGAGEDGELRRFGLHGISHEGSARSAAAFLGTAQTTLKMVTCHLGMGASVTAIDHGRPVDNSMGLMPLGGLVMARRSGDIDPGAMLYLLKERNISAEDLTVRLFRESGLLGLSGVSEDVLTVVDAANKGDAKALLALQVYCRQARKYLSSYIGLLGGVDAIVFTGGVGENSPAVRARICQGLDWMGIVLDEARNRSARVGRGEVVKISQDNSRAHVLVVGSNEQRTIAVQAVRALSHRRITGVIRHQHRPIPIGVSAHHVHLTQEHVETLFGPGHTLTWQADLTQPGQFACKERVNLLGPKGRVDRVRILGPVRPESQVEIARTEEFKLGIDAPVRMSGDLDGTPGIVLEGPAGKVVLDHGVICAMRHIHMEPQDAMEFAVRDRDVVRIRVPGKRSLIFGDVVVRVSPDSRLDMHIDTDEANAAELGPEAVGYLDSIQERVSV